VNLESQIQVTGILTLILAIGHIVFPARFKWSNDLKNLSSINRKIFISHCLMVVLVLMLIGGLCSFCSTLLVNNTPLAAFVCLGLFIFWFFGFLCHLILFKAEESKGVTLSASEHVIFLAVSAYFSSVFAMATWFQI